MSSFFSRFHKAGTTAITQQDIKIKTVKVPAAAPTTSTSTSTTTAPTSTNSHGTSSTIATTKNLAIRDSRLPPKQLSAPSPNSHKHNSNNKSESTSPPTARSTLNGTSKKLRNGVSSGAKNSTGGRGIEPSDSSTSLNGNISSGSKSKSLKRKESSTTFPGPGGSTLRFDSPSTSSLRSASPEAAGSDSTGATAPKKRRLTPHRSSPIQERLVSSDDESGSSDEDITKSSSPRRKRERTGCGQAGADTRSYLHPQSFKPERMCFVHAEQIANAKKEGYRRVFPANQIKLQEVSLFYPAMPLYERYALVQPRDPDEFNPLGDIVTSIEMAANYLLTSKERLPISTENSPDGILRTIKRSIKRLEPDRLAEGIERYNKLVRQYRKSGTFQKNIERMGKNGGLPFPLVEHLLTQSYARSVALDVESLRKYVAFSNNVYGELLPKFTSKLFKDTKLSPDQVFVDLGSGTGNVVLHAALEVGCESWGCEVMEKACELAAAQASEFEARLRLWGIAGGKVTLEKGDFCENANIAKVLPRADVLLVNNYAFDSQLNDRLIHMFLDLKEGTQIISLKSFVPPNHVITPRNVDSPVNLLRVEEKEYFSGCVSWTNAPGKYYLTVVDRSMLQEFHERS